MLERLTITSAKIDQQTVLIVDDESTILSLFSAYARALGHLPIAVASADEALGVLMTPRGVTVDTVLVDIMMPGRDGGWLIDRLLAHYPWIRVVIATGIDNLDARVSLKRNVVGYLVKPFGIDDLRTMLDLSKASRCDVSAKHVLSAESSDPTRRVSGVLVS
jgi:DNA-binding NtrC family response regulator